MKRSNSWRHFPLPLQAALLAVALTLLALAPLRAAEPLVAAVGPIGITVADLDRSAAFYRDVLDFTPDGTAVEIAGADWERLLGVFGLRARTLKMRLGGEEIELIEYLAPKGRPVPADLRSNDLAFQHIAIVTSDMERAYRLLRENRVESASTGPQRLPEWNPSAGGIEAFYFKDPDHHVLEILSFPPGKGEARWQARDRLFLGIDHTAIVVRDTDASLGFYRDTLGLRVAGTSENWGTEQEHLNNVFGARLRITALRAAGGPGIELLEYLSPRDGRPAPADSRANDLWHWQVELRVSDRARAEEETRRHHWVSPGWVAGPPPSEGFPGGLMVRDDDGHAMLLLARRP